MSMIFNYAQQGTFWVMAGSGTATANVNASLLLMNATDFFAPYLIRDDAIASTGDYPTSFMSISACDKDGNVVKNAAIPLSKFNLQDHKLDVAVDFSSNSNSGVAGFMVKLCVWTSQTGFNKQSDIHMQVSFGVDGSYNAAFIFYNQGSTYSSATQLGSDDSPVPWGPGFAYTATGMSGTGM
jgi:hypothetical protein